MRQVRAALVKLCEDFVRFMGNWDTTELDRLRLTSVGFAIGHSFVSTYVENFTEVEVWL
jgi:hypothetical protein